MQRLTQGETWIDPEECAYNTYSGAASGSGRKARVRFDDGQLRIVRVGVADSAWTCPAKPAHGRIGFVSFDDETKAFRFHAPRS